jgi:hypothetical protein
MSGTLSAGKELLEECVALDLPNLHLCVASHPSLIYPLEPWNHFKFHGEDKILVAMPDKELSLHRLVLVMKNSEGLVGREKVKGGSERGEREDKKDGNVLRAAPLTRPRLTSTDHARPPTLNNIT